MGSMERKARLANIREWARGLTGDEISWLLSERRTSRTPDEIKALVEEEIRRNV